MQALLRARPECAPFTRHLHLWNLRGFNADLTTLRPQLEHGLAQHQFGRLIADPVYKLLGERDEIKTPMGKLPT